MCDIRPGSLDRRVRSSAGHRPASLRTHSPMRTRSKLLIAGFTAALMLTMAVSSASAGRLSITNRNFRISWAALELSSTAGTGPIRCPLTVEGSFHSATARKTVGALVGYVSRGTALTGACTAGRATVNQASLPWHVRYRGFTGTLPTITGVAIGMIGMEFTVNTAGINCTTRTTAEEPAVGIMHLAAGGGITGARADETFTIPLNGAFCALSGRGVFKGTGAVSVLGTTNSISIRLI